MRLTGMANYIDQNMDMVQSAFGQVKLYYAIARGQGGLVTDSSQQASAPWKTTPYTKLRRTQDWHMARKTERDMSAPPA